jgi:hypothetical protein
MSSSNYIGSGAFIIGLLAGIFLATVDPFQLLIETLINVLKQLWESLSKLYPEAYLASIQTMFMAILILLSILPVVSFISDLAKILSYGLLNFAAFVFGLLAGVFIMSNQGIATFFMILGIFSAAFVEVVVRSPNRSKS